jgi:hypothetical protein
MNSISELMKTSRWCYWLDQSHPDPDNDDSSPPRFRVSVVFESEPGHFPTGGGESYRRKAPWYWDERTCDDANAKLGMTPKQAFAIVLASMRMRRHRHGLVCLKDSESVLIPSRAMA